MGEYFVFLGTDHSSSIQQHQVSLPPHLNQIHFPIPFINLQKHLILLTNPLIPTALRQFFQLHKLPFEVLSFVGITCRQGSQMQFV